MSLKILTCPPCGTCFLAFDPTWVHEIIIMIDDFRNRLISKKIFFENLIIFWNTFGRILAKSGARARPTSGWRGFLRSRSKFRKKQQSQLKLRYFHIIRKYQSLCKYFFTFTTYSSSRPGVTKMKHWKQNKYKLYFNNLRKQSY